ncbi:uncharacterized protein Z520_05618 [Fonsecaea multimorphosa CBS 102226]|uniref:Uncharacterized protein n=1 Tax=Fonsecaea multimorphosa CBS 102226 TaxID=1442371 RepID=A0A0D2JXQ0_9EURO|nr:uncharacterized protein Z520_05618 [Fonsecaea multimorphosa CBS 102226]KIX98317.1 hypothetical protein Z520_05618 [Fonsecaea multimorphosa CBS 102226]OAL24512.1 hypothetical protein AYO22_05301 [Fonsecaea multimorphosa]
MFFPVFLPLIALLLSSPINATEQPQKTLVATQTQEPNPTITASVKSIFSSLSGDQSTTFDAKSFSGCCDPTCALGLCNGIYPFDTTPPPDAARTGTASPAIATETCCSAGCPDGFCRGFERWRHGWPIAACVGRSCAVPTGQRWSHWTAIDRAEPVVTCVGRTCFPGTNGPFMTIFKAADSGASHTAKPTDTPSPNANAAETDPTRQFYAAELAGQDQDTLPIIVENNAKEPVTLLADIDLALIENYISSGMLSALGISPTSSELSPIAKEDQRPAALGTPAFKVTPESKITLNLLVGPAGQLKQFADVEFNVFDLPPVSERGGVPWEPEAFLGLTFLREASALRLTDGFAGHAALEGLPVLVRDIQGAPVVEDSDSKEVENGRRKDEL